MCLHKKALSDSLLNNYSDSHVYVVVSYLPCSKSHVLKTLFLARLHNSLLERFLVNLGINSRNNTSLGHARITQKMSGKNGIDIFACVGVL